MRMVVAVVLVAGCAGAGTESAARSGADSTPAIPSAGESAPIGTIPIARDTVLPAEVLRDPQTYLSTHQNVRGTCLGWRGPASGPQPNSRSDWQIGDTAHALWVVGSLPAGCTGEGGGGVVVIRAYVAADTVPLQLGGVPDERVYLIRRK